MRCLIDADILVYEIANSGQTVDPESGELHVVHFDKVAELLDQKIQEIEAECWATEPSILFLTGDRKLVKSVNRKRKHEDKPQLEFKPNFRFQVAKKKEYKGTVGRKKEKPFHFDNIREYMMAKYQTVIAHGIEADDLICVYLTLNGDRLSVICCSRDKDLRMVSGMHFGWECGKQPQFGPQRVTELGELKLSKDRKVVKGNGLKFFYSQLITGDSVDNIPGLPRGGPVLAFESISDTGTEAEMFDAVVRLYEQRCGEGWREYLREQIDLLWMIRELSGNGEPVRYVMFDERA